MKYYLVRELAGKALVFISSPHWFSSGPQTMPGT
jgi:hypothetical protein